MSAYGYDGYYADTGGHGYGYGYADIAGGGYNGLYGYIDSPFLSTEADGGPGTSSYDHDVTASGIERTVYLYTGYDGQTFVHKTNSGAGYYAQVTSYTYQGTGIDRYNIDRYVNISYYHDYGRDTVPYGHGYLQSAGYEFQREFAQYGIVGDVTMTTESGVINYQDGSSFAGVYEETLTSSSTYTYSATATTDSYGYTTYTASHGYIP